MKRITVTKTPPDAHGLESPTRLIWRIKGIHLISLISHFYGSKLLKVLVAPLVHPPTMAKNLSNQTWLREIPKLAIFPWRFMAGKIIHCHRGLVSIAMAIIEALLQ